MSKRTSILSALVLAGALTARAAAAPVTLVICAPGYPGSTNEAQPSMDALAAAVATAVSWPASRMKAEYYETEAAGVARLQAKTPSLALVPLPFFLVHEHDLKLQPRAQAVEQNGEPQVTWTLVAKKGRVKSAADLSGFTIVGLAGYAPEFVRNVALGKWGKLPSDVTFEASSQVLSGLRRSASGDKVAVLLDASQSKALATLPFAADLDVVATSPPIPGFLVCAVSNTAPRSDVDPLVAGMLRMAKTPEGAASLDAVRLARFVPLDEKGLSAARAAYAPAGKSK